MYEIIKLDSKNYKQYAPFDIVAFRDVYEVIDRSKRVFDLVTAEKKHRAPLYELFHFPKRVSFYDTIDDSTWKPIYLGNGQGIRMHYSISYEFSKRTDGMQSDELRKKWREIVIGIINDMQQYDIFEYSDMPENEYAQVKKVNEYERLKSKIHIGDSYSDIKAKLPSVMTLYDVQGRKMLEMKANSESEKIFVGDLPRGIYMLRVANAGGTTLHKVILE